MRRFFYAKMAVQNIRKNSQTYTPYLLTCICAVSMFYIVSTLANDPSAGSTTSTILKLGVWVIAIFSVLFLFYTNSFLMKRRKKEFGLMSVLGMEKRHIARIITLETLFVFCASILLGLGVGVLFSKLAHLVLLALLKVDYKFGFSLSFGSMRTSLLLFGGIFVLLLLSSLVQIGRAHPIELVHGGEVGEREPRARWLIALLGLIALGAGYYISVTTEEPIAVIMLFMVAVILVIIGTYLLFIAGSIALLKLLRRKKGYYYKLNHFISVSGMMYRMKQNAAGLATICILATMVLVMISSTAALYFGIEDSLDSRHLRELTFGSSQYSNEDVVAANKAAHTALDEMGLEAENLISYRVLSCWGFLVDDTLEFEGTHYNSDNDNSINLIVIHIDDYNKYAAAPVVLDDSSALLCTSQKEYGRDTLNIAGYRLDIREGHEAIEMFSTGLMSYSDSGQKYTLVVSDWSIIEGIKEENGSASISYQFGFDLDADDETQKEAAIAVGTALVHAGITSHYYTTRASNRTDFLETYGGLFFLGLFLTFVFLLATVLIIYYKQISEGYDDSRRYAIMQKVGLSRRESKRAINSQILMMFFLPLIMACIHMAFAFPALVRMLSAIDLNSTSLFALTTVISVAVFSVFYMLVYKLTAGVYYRLVESERR